MPPTAILVFAGVVLTLSVLLGVSLTQRDGSVGAPVRRRTALQIARIAIAPATRALLMRIEDIATRHPALAADTGKEMLRTALLQAFVVGEELPQDFGLGPEGDHEVHAAFTKFLAMVAGAVGEDGLAEAEQRLEVFRDPELRTPEGSGVWTWFPFPD
jgi:hypothetical protein